MHLDAFPAAVASECASDAGRFEEMHHEFFQSPDSIGKESWTTFALVAGVQDTGRFRECMRAAPATQRVVNDTLAARKLAIRGTPTFLINSLMVTGFGGQAEFTGYVERALRAAR
jgi:protein-disulfide isomerase